jgi:predicted dehydrogenase
MRVRVGVVGCGLISQVMHLRHLAELNDRFEVRALCDLSSSVLDSVGEAFPQASRHTEWQEMLEGEGLDAVLIATTGSHAPIAIAAAERGLHVFVEKPLCFSVEEGLEILNAAESAGVRLMVGYMKRFDPAYERLQHVLAPKDEIRLVRVTTLEAPFEPYVAHYPLAAPGQVDSATLAPLIAADEQRIDTALGTDDAVLREAYKAILLDSMVHEINAVRGLLGEPTELRFADVWGSPDGVTATVAFGDTECVFMWAELPGLPRYEQEILLYSPDERVGLVFPSPFLRNAPTLLVREGAVIGGSSSAHTEEIVSFDGAYKRELIEFHSCIAEGREPLTSGLDGLRDVALCESIIRSAIQKSPILSPTQILTEQKATALD